MEIGPHKLKTGPFDRSEKARSCRQPLRACSLYAIVEASFVFTQSVFMSLMTLLLDPMIFFSSSIESFPLQVRILRGRVVGSQSRSIDRDSCSQQELDYHVRHCELTGGT